MLSFLSKIKNFVLIILGGCIGLILFLLLPVGFDTIYNEIRLILLKERVKEYHHPANSQLWEKISLSGNFAPASNQCGFIVAEARTAELKPDDIRVFYAPILADVAYEKGPPYREVSLYILTDKKNVEDIELRYPDVYERITYATMTDPNAYLLLTAETGYPPNYDLRCH